MRATQLDDCKRDYNAAADEKRVAEEVLQQKVGAGQYVVLFLEHCTARMHIIFSKTDNLPHLKRRMHVWEKKFQVGNAVRDVAQWHTFASGLFFSVQLRTASPVPG